MLHDLTDPLIVDMIKEKHVPDEVYHWRPMTGKTLEYIICGQCAQEWPCQPVVELRQRQENGTGQHL